MVEKRNGVRTFCAVMAWLCVAGMISLPLTALAIWLWPGVFSGPIKGSLADGVEARALLELGAAQRFAALLVMAGGVALQVAALWFLRRTFMEGAAARWFSLDSVRAFRRFAWLCVAMVVYTVFHSSAMSVIVTAHLPQGQRMLNVTFTTENLQFLFGALIMLSVAHMFAAGREIAEENAAIL